MVEVWRTMGIRLEDCRVSCKLNTCTEERKHSLGHPARHAGRTVAAMQLKKSEWTQAQLMTLAQGRNKLADRIAGGYMQTGSPS